MQWDRTRFDWLGLRPFNGPRFNGPTCERIVIHYIGTPKAPRDFKPWMLNTHNATMARKPPYAYMYNCAVDLDGVLWQGRGLDFRNAANKETNPTTFSIVLGVDGQNEANPKQIEAVRRAVAGVRAFCNKPLTIIGHRDVMPTSCPGEGIYAQVRNGTFEPQSTPTPPTPVQPQGGLVEMIVLDYLPNTPNWVATLWSGNTLAWIVDGNADKALRSAKVTRVTVTRDEFAGIIRSATTVTTAPTGLDNALRSSWQSQRR
jgi:hypothetical protein